MLRQLGQHDVLRGHETVDRGRMMNEGPRLFRITKYESVFTFEWALFE